MGRKGGGGRRGFMKAARRGADDDPDETTPAAEEVTAVAESPEQDAGENHPLSACFLADAPAASGGGAVSNQRDENENSNAAPGPACSASNDEAENAQESRGKVIQRHKREMKEFKARAKRAGKKAKDEMEAEESAMHARHASELQALDALPLVAASDEEAGGTAHGGWQAESQTSTKAGKKSKGQKRRERLQAAEAEREAAIAEEVANMGESERVAEEKALRSALLPLGLRIVDIPADGNCMYRALAQQCEAKGLAALIDNGSALGAFNVLRAKAAAHIRAHRDDFAPFIVDADSPATADVQMEAFCAGVEAFEWGSQVELQALAASLSIHIEVHSARYPRVDLGLEFQESGKPSLQVCYLEFAYGSGEHYNSVGPLRMDLVSESGD